MATDRQRSTLCCTAMHGLQVVNALYAWKNYSSPTDCLTLCMACSSSYTFPVQVPTFDRRTFWACSSCRTGCFVLVAKPVNGQKWMKWNLESGACNPAVPRFVPMVRGSSRVPPETLSKNATGFWQIHPRSKAIGWDKTLAQSCFFVRHMVSFLLSSFFLHMFDYIFKQCNAGSLLDQMNSFWWLCCCKMNLTPLPPGIPALCHRMHAGWPRPCHQATRSGCELLVVWVAAWGVDRNRYHTDPYVFIVVCVCVNLGASSWGKICRVFRSFPQQTL